MSASIAGHRVALPRCMTAIIATAAQHAHKDLPNCHGGAVFQRKKTTKDGETSEHIWYCCIRPSRNRTNHSRLDLKAVRRSSSYNLEKESSKPNNAVGATHVRCATHLSTAKNMKHHRAFTFSLIIALLCILYIGFCFRVFLIKPSLRFWGSFETNEKQIISDWYTKNNSIPVRRVDLNTAIEALYNPFSPIAGHPIVVSYEKNGERSIYLGWQDSVAIFTKRDGTLVLSEVKNKNKANY